MVHQSENSLPPCILFEDDHLLVVNKPAGWNTHAPSPYAGEGIYDWLRHREPRWARLAIIHRLDKETSGVLVFAKTSLANRSLTGQFTQHKVRKKYLLLTDRPVGQKEFTAKSTLVRVGEKYVSRPLKVGGEFAETRFGVPASAGWAVANQAHGENPTLDRLKAGLRTIPAEPVTGRTHQIRVHAAEYGFPILGDTLYGGTLAHRVCLHAQELTLQHPATDEKMTFTAPADFAADVHGSLRDAIIEPELTNAYRLIHGAADGWPGWYVDRLGDFLLSQSEQPLADEQKRQLQDLLGGNHSRITHHASRMSLRGAYHKILARQIRSAGVEQTSPQHVLGETATEKIVTRENNVQFELSFSEGYSVGLFLDQRDNRRRLLMNHVAADFPLFQSAILNTFAYTCGFSVCAALAGARTTSLDLSKKYLEWGKRNFALNHLDPAEHDFIFGDTFDWLRRLAKKRRSFDVVLLDPPTFSRSKEHGAFQVEKDYAKLVAATLTLLKTGGVLFASANAAGWPPEKFLASVEAAIHSAKRKILRRHYVPQPPDFPITRAEPGYLKTVWLQIG